MRRSLSNVSLGVYGSRWEVRTRRSWSLKSREITSTKGLGAGVGVEVGGVDMEEVKEAYEVVKRIDVLDVSAGASWFPFWSFRLLLRC